MSLFSFFKKRQFSDLNSNWSPRQDVPTAKEFAEECRSYKSKLTAAENFDEIYKIWRSFNYDYKYDNLLPLSKAYKDEVLDLYKTLADGSYATNNELTSTKQSLADFEIGYPYISKNLQVINSELAKTMQAIAAVNSHGTRIQTIVEFGSGWGNLALPLAKAGRDVSVVDMDKAFLDRIEKLASRDNINIDAHLGDFVSVSSSMPKRYDAVIFQASFHHCLDFSELLDNIRNNVLEEGGVILFLCEPIFKDYPFPWGLRYDGESVWAIMVNKWLELGFSQDFFIGLLLSKGFYVNKIPGIDGYIGDGWSAVSARQGVDFEKLLLPQIYDETFYPIVEDGGVGRFCKKLSQLPRLQNKSQHRYQLKIQNYDTKPIRVKLSAGGQSTLYKLDHHETKDVIVDAMAGDLVIMSDTFKPSQTLGTADGRDIGVRLLNVRII